MKQPASQRCACGATKSSPEYTTCRECWRAIVTAGSPPHPLKLWADEKGWSMQQLAREAGLGPTTLRHIVRGRVTISGPSALALSRVTGLTCVELLSFDPGAA